MLFCKFRLNNLPMSALSVGATSFPAFSGEDRVTNQISHQCVPGGPIPKGTYYIVDRKSGGTLGPVWDKFTKAPIWFALYAADLRVDDKTYCDSLLRGEFRLHPAVMFGRSAGCITLPFIRDFQLVRNLIQQQEMFDVPCTNLKAYGQVIVS